MTFCVECIGIVNQWGTQVVLVELTSCSCSVKGASCRRCCRRLRRAVVHLLCPSGRPASKLSHGSDVPSGEGREQAILVLYLHQQFNLSSCANSNYILPLKVDYRIPNKRSSSLNHLVMLLPASAKQAILVLDYIYSSNLICRPAQIAIIYCP